MRLQFKTYVESKGMDPSNMTNVELKQAELSMISGNVYWHLIRNNIASHTSIKYGVLNKGIIYTFRTVSRRESIPQIPH